MSILSTEPQEGSTLHKRTRARTLLPFHIRGAFPYNYKGREGGLSHSEPRARLVKVVQVYCSVYLSRTNLYLGRKPTRAQKKKEKREEKIKRNKKKLISSI